jgi:hypothetical protein
VACNGSIWPDSASISARLRVGWVLDCYPFVGASDRWGG